MASKYETQDEEEEPKGPIAGIATTLLRPVQLLISTPARRAYLTTFLALSTSFFLLFVATAAYTLFYNAFIPQLSFSRPIHLQFDDVYPGSNSHAPTASTNPHGTIKLAPEIVSAQAYDVYIDLSLPYTPENCKAGNFMLEASMIAAGSMIDTLAHSLAPSSTTTTNVLATSRRSAILPYRSPIVDNMYKLTQLPWYLLNWRREVEDLRIQMFESVDFSRGWRNLPDTMRVEIQSPLRLQIYSAEAIFQARFSGLRWWMYNHRILSAIVCVSAFWTTEMLFAGLAWAMVSSYSSGPEPAEAGKYGGGIKQELSADEDAKVVLSDTERTFPSGSRQPALRYESPGIKQEDEDEDAVLLPPAQLQPNGTRTTEEADDEDNDDDDSAFRDSGLGTSMESSTGRRDSVRRRRARTGPLGDGQK